MDDLKDELREERRTNFFMVENQIFEYGIKPFEFMVYCFLLRGADNKIRAFLSYNNIAQYTGISRRKVIDSIKFLIERGFIKKEQKKSKNGKYNIYTILKLPEKELKQ